MGKRNYQGGTFTVKPNAERLKALRQSLPQKLSQHGVEDLAGISHGQLTRYETGKPASTQDLIKLGELYGVDPAELLAPEGLETCNQILEEMCMFTNKSVVVNTNGNSKEKKPWIQGLDFGTKPAEVVEVDNPLKEEDFCSKCGHAGKVKQGVCQERVGRECLDPEGEPCGCDCDVTEETVKV